MLDPYRLEIPVGVSYAVINTSAASTTLVNGVVGKRIVVLSISLVASSIVQATFQTSTGVIVIGGPYYCAQFGGVVMGHNAGGWFETAIGDSLLLSLSPGLPVGGSLSYALSSG